MSKIFDKFRYMDYLVFIPYVFLSIFGIIMVYSSSSYISMSTYDYAEHFFIRQSMFVGVGFGLFILVFLLSKNLFKRQKLVMMSVFGILGLLLYLLIFGTEIKGAKGWINIVGPFNLQPAEFTKLVVIWYIAFVFSKKQNQIIHDFKNAAIKPFLLVMTMILFIVLQPDVGNAAIIFLIAILMIFSSGASVKIGLFFSGLGFALVSLLAWVIRYHRNWLFFMKDYQYNRFLAFWDPFELAESTGMQLVNSYYALSRGGLFGVGLGESVQKTGYLPEPHTDFIISIIGEELGLLGIFILIGVFVFLIMRIYLIGIRSKNPFYSLCCIGIASMLLVQSGVNLGGLLGLLPITGVTFPFISYGGSSTLLLAMSMGVVCNIAASENKYREKQQATRLKSGQ